VHGEFYTFYKAQTQRTGDSNADQNLDVSMLLMVSAGEGPTMDQSSAQGIP
jgi:hypothetical protein